MKTSLHHIVLAALASTAALGGALAQSTAPDIDLEAIRELGLMTTKPFLYVFNVDEDQLTDEALQADLQSLVAPAEAIFSTLVRGLRS